MKVSGTDFRNGSRHLFRTLVVESSLVNAVEWTKPDDLTLDADDPKASLSSNSRGVTILYADGSVRTIAESEADELAEALFPRRK